MLKSDVVPCITAAYCRVSTDKEDQVNSFDGQREFFREYIGNMPDWDLFEIYADFGISGTTTKKRAEFNRMMAQARSGALDIILTKEISRFARNILDSIQYTRELRRLGVCVIFLNDGINTLDADAELRLAIMSSIAQEESRKTSERVKWGQRRQMERGVVFGRDMLGYDVRGGRMFVSDGGARIVRLIFNKFVHEGKGAHAIAAELRAAGYKTIRGGTNWSSAAIYKILRNEKYCGDLVQKKTYTPDYLSHEKKYNNGEEDFVILKDHHEPIISREIFELANRILDERAACPEGKAKYSRRYAFSGKISCGLCGATFVARFKTRQNGAVYRSWRCLTAVRRGKAGCGAKSLRNEDALAVMALVLGGLDMDKNALIKDVCGIVQSAQCLTSDTINQRIRGANARMERLIDLYTGGDITRDEFAAQRAKCESQLDTLRKLLSPDRPAHGARAEMAGITRKITEIARTGADETFMRNMLDKMIVHNDGIAVYLKFLPNPWRYTYHR